VNEDEGREQGSGRPPCPDGGDLVRQSTLAQVRDHTGPPRASTALAGEASRLVGRGWHRGHRHRPRVSGRSTEGRDGSRRWLRGVSGRSRCDLRVGGVAAGPFLGRPVRLLELARLTDTLVIDADGIYDLAEFNDRLLLGLKGTMSEASCICSPAGSKEQTCRGRTRRPPDPAAGGLLPRRGG